MIPKTGNVLESLLSDRTARVMGGLAARMPGPKRVFFRQPRSRRSSWASATAAFT